MSIRSGSYSFSFSQNPMALWARWGVQDRAGFRCRNLPSAGSPSSKQGLRRACSSTARDRRAKKSPSIAVFGSSGSVLVAVMEALANVRTQVSKNRLASGNDHGRQQLRLVWLLATAARICSFRASQLGSADSRFRGGGTQSEHRCDSQAAGNWSRCLRSGSAAPLR
jgi:hypothetical protein